MVQQPSSTPTFSTDFDHHVVLFPTRSKPDVTKSPVPLFGRRAVDRQVLVRARDVRQVAVLEVAGPLEDVVEDLDQAIQLALAEGPRGVACDLSAVLEGAEPGAVEVLATAGRHVRDWSGTPVAVACADPRVRAGLAAHPLGGHLIVTASIFAAVSAVLATPFPAVERLRLAPHPTAARASRDFVARTLQGWGLGQLILSTNLVVSELVTSSATHAGTEIELSASWNRAALRLTVRDGSPDLPPAQYTRFGRDGRGRTAIAVLSRASGVLPTAAGGKVVWAVLNAASPRPLISRRPPTRPTPA